MKKIIYATLIITIQHLTLNIQNSVAQATNDNKGPGNGLSFSGNEYADVPSSTVFDFGTNNFTLEAWVKGTDNSDYQAICYRINGCGANTGWGLQIQQTSGLAACYFGNIALVGTSDVLDGEWHHIAAVRNGALLTVYVDGAQEAQRNDVAAQNATAANSPKVRIGAVNNYDSCNPTAVFWSFLNTIDEVKVWNIALTQAQIKDNMCKQLVGNETGLVGYWNMNEGSGTTIGDLTANGNDGTLF